MDESKSIILFDGVCNLCDRSVRWVHKNDKSDQFLYHSLQSDFAKNVLKEHDLSSTALDTMVLVSNGKVYTRSSAALQIAKKLRFPWPMLSVFFIIPPFLRNAVYNFVAKHRYKWFGEKEEVCEFDPLFAAKRAS